METNFCQKKFRSILLLPLVIALFKNIETITFVLFVKKNKKTNKQTNKQTKKNKLKDLKTLKHFFYLFLPF